MVRSDPTIKIYRRLGKKRYLKGKHIYEHERIYVPIPSRLHDIVRPFLNQHLRIHIATQNNDLVITLHPQKRFGTPNDPRKNISKTPSRTLNLT